MVQKQNYIKQEFQDFTVIVQSNFYFTKMTQERLLSWIFYSVAMAMDLDHADYDEITIIADSMSSAPPSRREMKDSVEWLVRNNLVEGRKDIRLTETGKEIYARATRETKLIPDVWNNLERLINERLKDYAPPSQG